MDDSGELTSGGPAPDTFLIRISRYSGILAAIAAAAVLYTGVVYGSRAASGADAFGYVSQAQLWLDGELRFHQPFARSVPWPHARPSLTPIGYTTGHADATVPVYAIGVPIMMAGLQFVIGNSGPYVLAPIFGAVLICVTFGLGSRLSGSPVTGAIAALLMASSPAFLFNVMWPMSDTATAALWTAALCALTWPGLKPAGIAGVLAGLAVLVRPNLVPLALPCVVAAELWAGGRHRRGVRGMLVIAGIVPAALAVAYMNDYLYGSPLLSGYGPAKDLYAPGFFPINVRRYGGWLLDTENAVAALAVLGIVSSWRGAKTARLPLWPVGLLAVMVAASYLFYLPFDEWWYLRFVLPAFPLLFILAASGVMTITRLMPARVAAPLLVAVVVAVAGVRVSMALDRGVLELGESEDRYVAVAEYIEKALPPNAVVFAMQHSGSIRYYSGRLTIRYDWITPGRLVSSIEWLRSHGYRPYIVIDDSEEDQFRARFKAQGPIGHLDLRVIAQVALPVKVRIFDPAQIGIGASTTADRILRKGRPYLGPSPHWPLGTPPQLVGAH